MTIDHLRESVYRRPFSPFTLHLSDGRSFQVRHPEFVMMSQKGRVVAVATEGNVIQTIDTLMITSVESGNGDAFK